MVEKEEVLKAHSGGKIEVISKVPTDSVRDLSIYYTPGVAYVSEEIAHNRERVYDYTSKGNTIAIISDGTRILGLGDLGPYAAMPVMEGKALLFKKFGGVDAVPICVDTKDEAEIVRLVKDIAPTFGGINIEDIKSPRCITIAERLSKEIDVPVLHDDRQGTGVVVLAAAINAVKLAGKDRNARIVINGAGAAGYGILERLHHYGFRNIIVVDTKGAIFAGRAENDDLKERIASMTNPQKLAGSLHEVVAGADMLIGVSSRGAFTREDISKMASKPIIFALANPYPEISYAEAREAGAYIVATGRSDTPNQVNNLLAFPGLMRGMLDIRAKALNDEMLDAASMAISKGVGKRLSPEYIIPGILEKSHVTRVVPDVAAAVAEAGMRTGQARVMVAKEQVRKHAKELLKRYGRIERKAIGVRRV
ncbi:MAG: NADP-dependent malic enzyme [Candidatus Micrarchaeota archaeon]|nr:NADP-dependent malic enzyme [Candidatus Micrarchaeota archaeon]